MIFIKTQACYSGNNVTLSLRASSPIWASEKGLARTREALFACPNRRACSQAMYVTLCAGARHSSRHTGRPFPSSSRPLYQNEVRCSTFLVEISFICMRMKNHFHSLFHIKGWAPNLVLIQRPGGTRKWPISLWPSIWLTDWRQGQGPSSTVNQGALRQRFFLVASPLVSSRAAADTAPGRTRETTSGT